MVTYKKVGGIHFVRVLRFGFNFYWSRKAQVSKREMMLVGYEPHRLASIRLPDGRRVFRVI